MSGQDFNEGEIRSEDLQRFAELGRLSASLLHEISNPLSVALLHLDQLGDQTSLSIKHVRRNLVRLTHYVNAARGQISTESDKKSFYVGTQIRDIKYLTAPVARASYVKLKINKPARIRVQGNRLQFQQILTNLIINAIEAYPKTDRLSKERLVKVEFSNESSYLIIRVSDCGSGFGTAEVEQVFEPFYTTKSNKGLGLGLAIVKGYVESGFNGTISVSTNDNLGTCFSIKMPHL